MKKIFFIAAAIILSASSSSLSQDMDEDPNGPQETCATESACAGGGGVDYCKEIWNVTRTEKTVTTRNFGFTDFISGCWGITETTTVETNCATGGSYRCPLGYC